MIGLMIIFVKVVHVTRRFAQNNEQLDYAHGRVHKCYISKWDAMNLCFVNRKIVFESLQFQSKQTRIRLN
ncbi:MAG TPA: hypothetical protein DCK95_12085 [Anaerolineaceae bacterium]|nr:hypothetical protein [Anaerolineaceae bacterium]